MNRYFKIALIILFILLFNISVFSQNDKLNLKIGIYNNPPKIFIDEEDNPAGFWPEIIRDIADKENWTIEWVKGSFAQNMRKLKNNEIDIMPDVAYSEKRNNEYDFNKEAMFINWGRIYSFHDDYIESFLDLRNKKIAVMENGIHYIGDEGIKNLLKRFDIKCEFIEKDSYEEVFKSLKLREVDAGVVNRIFGNKNFDNYKLKKTPIIINPIELKLAFTKDAPENSLLINSFDYHLKKIKSNNSSIYYKLMKKWVGSLPEEDIVEIIPGWIITSLSIILGLLILAVIIILITKQQIKKRTEDLKRSEEKFKSYIENSPDGIFVADSDGNYVDVNKTATEITGYSKDELLEMKLYDLIPDSDKNKAISIFNQVKEEGKSVGEISFITKNNKKRYWVIKAVKIANNKFLGFTDDITEMKKSEREKERLQRQLAQAQKLESIGTLASGIAHDFNNIITVIKGTSELLLHKIVKSNDLYKDIKSIHKSSKKAENLTKKILLFSRVKDMKLKKINLNQSIKNMMGLLERLITENIKINTEFEKKLWFIKADNSHIEQIIMNLIINSRDAMSPEGGELYIRTRNRVFSKKQTKTIPNAEPGKYVEIEIEDTGEGIDKDIIDHIFDPFFTTKKRSKGTGMGLSVVYGIVQEHNGFIQVDSEKGKGAILKVYIPAVDSKVKKQSKEKKDTVDVDKKDLKGNKENILIIEDEKGVLELIEDILEKFNYKYISTETGKEAEKIFDSKKEEIDLIISDIILTDINGIKLVDKLRKVKKDMKVILTSGYSDEKVLHQKMKEKGYYFIQKPFSIKELAYLVKKVLKNN